MNFDQLNPIVTIDQNVILTHLGDISLAYKIELPEVNTISVTKYNEMHTAFKKMLSILPENTVIHRQDIFLKKELDVSRIFKKDDFFESSLYHHFEGRNYLDQNSYLYITLLDSLGFKRKIATSKYFKRITHPESFSKKMDNFKNACQKAISILKNEIDVRVLEKKELVNLISSHFNGYELNKITSPIFRPNFKIGKKEFAIYGLDDDYNQKDGEISLCVINSNMSTEISKMHKSYLSVLGNELNYEHVVNSFIFYDNQQGVKSNLLENQKKLKGVRLLATENNFNADRIDSFLKSVEDENLKVVRSHINITLFDSDNKMLEEKERNIQAHFSKMGITPTEYNYLDYPYIYLSNTPGCAGHLPEEYTFYTFMELALVYLLYEGNKVKNDKKGFFYTDRNYNIPFKLDTFYEPYENKMILNRNYFVIAPSGGGKSFSSKSRLYQQYKDGFDQVVINIGGDDKLVRMINANSNDAMYVLYKEGEKLPVNPFYVIDYITNDKLEFLIDFIWLLWGGTDEINSDEHSILNKILVNYYNLDTSNYDQVGGGFKLVNIDNENLSIKSFYNYVVENQKIIKSYFNNDDSLFNVNSLLVNLEKFAIGSYSNLFETGKPDIYEAKKYIEFELDNIKEHKFLFPLFSMLISDITFNTMWKKDGYKDFFIDEGWKILEKKGMALLLKYLFKTIRKFDGAVGIAVQQITDLFVDEIIANAIIGNCAIKYILDHKEFISTVPRLKKELSLTNEVVAMLLSIKNKFKLEHKDDKIRYAEQLIVLGSSFAKVVRIEVSPEIAVIYDSEKKKLKGFDDLYRESNGDIERTIINYLK